MEQRMNGTSDKAGPPADLAADELEQGAEGMEEELASEEAVDGFEQEVEAEGVDEDGFSEEELGTDEMESDAMELEGSADAAVEEEDALEQDGMEAELADEEGEALSGDEAVEAEGDAWDEEAGGGIEASDAWEGEAFEASADEQDGSVESTFVDTLADEGEDAFWRLVLERALRSLGGGGAVGARPPWQLAGQIVAKLARPGRLGGATCRHRPRAAAGTCPCASARIAPQHLDAMDVYADAVDEFAADGVDAEEFVAPLAGFATRYAVKATVSPRARAARRAAVVALGRATARSVQRSARTLIRRYGPAAARAVPRIVRDAVCSIVERRSSPRVIPALIERGAARAAKSARVARRLARPSKAARRVRRRAGIRPGAPLRGRGYAQTPLRSYGRRGRIRTLVLRGPVRITFRR